MPKINRNAMNNTHTVFALCKSVEGGKYYMKFQSYGSKELSTVGVALNRMQRHTVHGKLKLMCYFSLTGYTDKASKCHKLINGKLLMNCVRQFGRIGFLARDDASHDVVDVISNMKDVAWSRNCHFNIASGMKDANVAEEARGESRDTRHVGEKQARKTKEIIDLSDEPERDEELEELLRQADKLAEEYEKRNKPKMSEKNDENEDENEEEIENEDENEDENEENAEEESDEEEIEYDDSSEDEEEDDSEYSEIDEEELDDNNWICNDDEVEYESGFESDEEQEVDDQTKRKRQYDSDSDERSTKKMKL
jgi:hypothetical protein